ncbi:MAG: SDR family NAD(P)-dependent oxidoreductase, partial [Betaproteobacteria bacterium]|nr:SDR family NAD(P)-dependent oxidoreductase [Betaproteobacteria bacterium]
MVVFLTGASSGIGEALAREYAAQGATLGLVARRADVLESLRQSLPSGAETYTADVRDLGALKAAAADFMSKHGVPDLVIANAGVSHGTLTEHADDIDVFRKIMDINVIGMVNTFHPFVAAMRNAGRG